MILRRRIKMLITPNIILHPYFRISVRHYHLNLNLKEPIHREDYALWVNYRNIQILVQPSSTTDHLEY